MSCKSCGSKSGSCGCPNGSGGITTSQLSAQIAQLNDEVMAITNAVAALMGGNPIWMIQTANDIACFNLTTGLGSGKWLGWGLCNGMTYATATTPPTNTVSPNLFDKFIVCAGGTYTVGATGGAASVSLTALQNGPHTHTIVDAGHSHNITDPGHHHSIVDLGHGHGGSSTPHVHTFTTNANGAFTLGVPDPNRSFSTGALSNDGYLWDGTTYSASQAGGVHTHTGTTDTTSVTVAINNSFTGITQTTNAFIGITQTDVATTGITIVTQGAGAAHENRPPYFALAFIIKI